MSPGSAPATTTGSTGGSRREKGSGRAKRRKAATPAAAAASTADVDNSIPPAVEVSTPAAETAVGDTGAGAVASNHDGGGEVARSDDSALEIELASLMALDVRTKGLFEWVDGPLVTAMRNGEMILLDELSLADDAVLERLNSVLEPGRSITLAEKGGEGTVGGQGAAETVVAAPGFRCVVHGVCRVLSVAVCVVPWFASSLSFCLSRNSISTFLR